MTGKVYFVSGIDTDVGKTIVTGLMARHLRFHGVDACTIKMVQTGCVDSSEDFEAHRRIAGLGPVPEDEAPFAAPQIFRFPSSPRLAARLEGREVDLAKIASAVEYCASRHDIVLVEGAGGLAVPLTSHTLAIDFAASRAWPVILVTCGRLGAINHIILSLEAIKSRGMSLAAVVHNFHPKADPQIDADTLSEIREHLSRLGYTSPIVAVANVASYGVMRAPDFSPVFE